MRHVVQKLLLLLLTSTIVGEAESSWIGQLVFVKDRAVLKVGRQVVYNESHGRNPPSPADPSPTLGLTASRTSTAIDSG